MDVWQTCFLVPGFTRTECASWVQAWGSVLAILAAVAIAWQQHRAERAAAALSARVRAELAASSILLRLEPILEGIRSVHDTMHEDGKVTEGRQIKPLLSLLDGLVYPATHELEALADHVPKAARTLIQARNQIWQAQSALSLLLHRVGHAGDVELQELNDICYVLRMGADRFREAQKMLDELEPQE